MPQDIFCRLYLISPSDIILSDFAESLKSALDGGDVASFQLRLKDSSDDAIKQAIDTLLPITMASDVAFILNDRPDLAAEMGCDGVHIGQSDMPIEEARKRIGENAILGMTCHDSRHLAMVAGEKGADYVAFGAFYPTLTKPTDFRPDPSLLEWWAELMEIPSVAIGGITTENCTPLIAAKADFLAVCSAVWNSDSGPAHAVKAFNQKMGRL